MTKTSSFAKVHCKKCKNEQIIFLRAASPVVCLVCEEIIASSKGGKLHVTAEVVEVLN